MIANDLSYWPLVITVLRGAPSLDDQQEFFEKWGEWFEREEPFATLRIYGDVDSLTRPEGSGQQSKAWFLTNSERVKNLVIGMATVTPPGSSVQQRRMNAQKIHGIPAQTFDSVAAAIAWLDEEVLMPRGRRLDLRRLEASLDSL